MSKTGQELSDQDPFPNYRWDADTQIPLMPNPNGSSDECTCCDCGDCQIPCDYCESGGDDEGESKIPSDKWHELWPVGDDEIDPLLEAADFYTLQGIVNGVGAEGTYRSFKDHSVDDLEVAAEILGIGQNKLGKRVAFGRKKEAESVNPIEEIQDRALEMIDEQVDRILEPLFNYIDMACGGELRHHNAFVKFGVLPSHRSSAWLTWKRVRDEHGTEALDIAEQYFLDFPQCSFGGPKWASGPALLAQYERGELGPDRKSNRRMFIDRVFTLVHNNGCMLNKLSWNNLRNSDRHHNSGVYSEDIEYMKYILSWHSQDVPDMESLANVASDQVHEIYTEYVGVLNEL